MSKTMRAAVLRAPYTLEVLDVPRPTVTEPGDVLLKVEKTAICGTDLHPYEGRIELESDVILGHEFLGTVVEAGPAVQQLSPGDRAVASCVVHCGHCRACRRFDPARCAGSRIFGLGIALGGLDGAQSEYVVVPNADLVLRRLPEKIRSSEDDLLFAGDIMTTGYEAVRRALRPGDTVAVVGAGPVGLCAAMSAVALGAEKVIVIDLVPERLAEAAAVGAVPVNAAESDPYDAVLDLTEWRGADVVIDGVGAESALKTACRVVAPGGTISIPGVYLEESMELPFGELWLRGVSILTGVANIVNHMDEVMALTEAGRLTPSRITSHRLPLTRATEAYELFEQRQALKIILDPQA
ncbi:alcohol dehydrogenase catalytic domain-containing protein [Streptomyces sp. R39]|uniref:Alcohol dehydrogenase catalytic domain-containing protein n=1 Tax=Streptomyces sp. R39 TaxID=3238631 RepID=A0AB39R4I7_9ACTN